MTSTTIRCPRCDSDSLLNLGRAVAPHDQTVCVCEVAQCLACGAWLIYQNSQVRLASAGDIASLQQRLVTRISRES